MNFFFTFLFVCSILTLTFALCPSGAIPSISDNTTCFLFVIKKQAFLLAEEYCNQQNGHLTSIHNAFDNIFIREHAQNTFTESTNADFWIGLNDVKNSGTWGWIDGSVLDFVDWDKGQPNNTAGFDCGAVKLLGGAWITGNCDEEKSYVCNIKSSTTPPSGKCPDNWKFYDKTGDCYYVGTNKTWEQSEDYCLSQNSHLASIHSLEENSFVTNLIPFDPNNHECQWQQLAWIGLYTVTNEASWHWIDGTIYNYSLWAPQRPSCATSFCYCGVIWNGPPCNAPPETWADGICSYIYGFFICKKTAVNV